MRAESTRIACLLLPDLPLRAELRAHPELTDYPLVIATSSDARAEVIAISAAARRAGVRPGGSVTHARAICSELRVRVASPALERGARQTLLDIALSFSPRAAAAPRATATFAGEAAVFLDASGVSALFHSERGFASAVGRRAETLGLPGTIAVASSRIVAQLAARYCAGRLDGGAAAFATADGSTRVREGSLANAEGSLTDADGSLTNADGSLTNADGPLAEAEGSRTCVLPPGSETAFLAPLPIDVFDPDDRLSRALLRFGVHTVRDLLRLPRRALTQRLGPEILSLSARVRGEEPEVPLPHPTDLRFEEALDLECSIDHLEPLTFVLRGLISRLTERLILRNLSCGPLDLRLELEGGGRDARRVEGAAPTRDARMLLRWVVLALETRPPEAPVEGISLSTEGRPARMDQLDLFRPCGPDPSSLDRTLCELESLCGPGRVGAPEVADDHRPDAFEVKPFRTRPASQDPTREPSRTVLAGDAAHLSVRALRPAVAAQVQVHRGCPSSIRSAVSSGCVVHAAGPWRTTGRWWSEEERFAVDYFDVQVSDGTLLRLRFDWIAKRWEIDAVYD